MMDHTYLHACDLQGRDVTVTIAKVTAGELVALGGRKSKKPLIYFQGKEKPLGMNTTNCKTCTSLFGTPDTDAWIGKRITLYPTQTQMNGEATECIRIRPTLPPDKAPKPTSPADPAEEGSDA